MELPMGGCRRRDDGYGGKRWRLGGGVYSDLEVKGE